MNSTKIKIQGLKAVTDVEHVEKALEAVAGVQSVEVDTSVCEAIVQHSGADPDQLVEALKPLGYPSSVV